MAAKAAGKRKKGNTANTSTSPASTSKDVPTTAVSAPVPRTTAQLDMEMQESVLRTVTRAVEVRPVNTTRTYESKQKEWRQWCEDKGFEEMSRYQVTSTKLHLFFEERVLHREPKRQKKTTNVDGTVTKKTLSESTVRSYVAAVTDLYTQQQARGVNSSAHPRPGPVRMLLGTRKLEERDRKKREHVDRGIGTALDGYNQSQFCNVSNYFLLRNNETGLRDRLAFLISHYALLRGENARNLELADLHHLDLEGEGPSDCFAVVLLLANGKANQAGRVEYGSFLRNRDVRVCPIGGLALYLFSRFHHSAEPFPNLSSSSLWYDLKVIKAPKSRSEPIDEQTHSKALDAAFKACGVLTTAKTHAARKSGAQLAEAGGANEASVRRAGRWNQTTMETCYLTRLPRPVLRVHAGFHQDGGSYFLRRDVAPPEDLLQRIFPQADAWDIAIASGEAADGSPVQINIASRAFVRLLIRLRPVLLQDAVLLKKEYPQLYLWSHAMFHSEAFVEYETELLKALDKPDTSGHDQLRAVLSLLAEQIQAHSSATQQHVDEGLKDLREDIERDLEMVVELLQGIREQQQQQMNEMHATMRGILGFLLAANGGPSLSSPSSLTTLLGSISSSSSSSSLVPTSTTVVAAATTDTAVPRIGQRSGSAARSSSVRVAERMMPAMSQDRGISSCAELWREYKDGLKGMPSVEHMDSEWGAAWRASEKDRKHYERRMRIIGKIKDLAVEKKVSEKVALVLLEHARNQLANKSLAKLSDHIREGKELSYPDLSLSTV
ncbi:unnamed protein product [Tilletia laevis]|uniref:Ndc10 domain-containing protein n=4 Tax=Tilletia TaxID=13289 RepID=A0A8X7MQG2_9BASI|nr:hypothetical protein CF336_g5699 [Tilletia laevis]KAE8194803.1 hypothetical protein CF328_g4633 [Tilletia controversa]CAD6890814.1 unnamed protein product [Tilletia caries]KAE8196450.1 hypothetical protein CF335_g4860 [Tilletia laevis]KAE8243761.1 hypothetical protein A4X06_0g6116 [Tilletia controversa]